MERGGAVSRVGIDGVSGRITALASLRMDEFLFSARVSLLEEIHQLILRGIEEGRLFTQLNPDHVGRDAAGRAVLHWGMPGEGVLSTFVVLKADHTVDGEWRGVAKPMALSFLPIECQRLCAKDYETYFAVETERDRWYFKPSVEVVWQALSVLGKWMFPELYEPRVKTVEAGDARFEITDYPARCFRSATHWFKSTPPCLDRLPEDIRRSEIVAIDRVHSLLRVLEKGQSPAALLSRRPDVLPSLGRGADDGEDEEVACLLRAIQ